MGALGEQYNAIDPEERAGVMSASNVWHRVCQDNYKELCALWMEGDCAGMVELMEAAADPGPVGNGPARQEWEEAWHPEEPNHE